MECADEAENVVVTVSRTLRHFAAPLAQAAVVLLIEANASATQSNTVVADVRHQLASMEPGRRVVVLSDDKAAHGPRRPGVILTDQRKLAFANAVREWMAAGRLVLCDEFLGGRADIQDLRQQLLQFSYEVKTTPDGEQAKAIKLSGKGGNGVYDDRAVSFTQLLPLALLYMSAYAPTEHRRVFRDCLDRDSRIAKRHRLFEDASTPASSAVAASPSGA